MPSFPQWDNDTELALACIVTCTKGSQTAGDASPRSLACAPMACGLMHA